MDTGPIPPESAAPRPPDPVPAPASAPGPWGASPLPPEPPRRRTGILQVLTAILLALSVIGNVVFLVIIFGLMASVVGGGAEDTYFERVIEKGPSSQKIAVIRVDGLIDEDLAERLHREMKRAAEDSKVKAVILRINSPGGGLTASDMIHYQVKSVLTDSGKPVVAAMDGVAASGGYYVACAADKIVAQQTTITGSIGVLAQFFFLNGLLKDKLGVTTVTLKMGDQKDWPNMFADTMTPQQSEYLMDSLLKPGYDHFVDIVAESRKMDRQKVLALATGRIFTAKEAQRSGLIDEIGYFERAVALAKEAAGISDARVVEYVQPFSLVELLGVSAKRQTWLDLRPENLARLGSPRVMYLWTGL